MGAVAFRPSQRTKSGLVMRRAERLAVPTPALMLAKLLTLPLRNAKAADAAVPSWKPVAALPDGLTNTCEPSRRFEVTLAILSRLALISESLLKSTCFARGLRAFQLVRNEDVEKTFPASFWAELLAKPMRRTTALVTMFCSSGLSDDMSAS